MNTLVDPLPSGTLSSRSLVQEFCLCIVDQVTQASPHWPEVQREGYTKMR